jgi:hypothetical protein
VDNFVTDLAVSHPGLCTFLAVCPFNMLRSYPTDFSLEDEDCMSLLNIGIHQSGYTSHSPEENDLNIFLLHVACASLG